MNKIHNGIIDVEKRNSLKDSGLNNFDLGTTKMYRGVKPMFEQLGFTSPNFNNPSQQVYWNNIIPTDFDYFNLSGIEVQQVETDGDVGVTEGAKVSRESFWKRKDRIFFVSLGRKYDAYLIDSVDAPPNLGLHSIRLILP